MQGTLSAVKLWIFLFWLFFVLFFLHVCAFIWAGFNVVLVSGHCVHCVAACLMQCTPSSKTKSTACLSSTRSRGMHFIFSHTRGSSSSSSFLWVQHNHCQSVCDWTYRILIYMIDDKELVPFLLVCFPLVVNVENVETMSWVECDPTENIPALLCVCLCVCLLAFSRCVKCQSQLSWSKLLGNWALVHTTTLLSFTRTRPSSKRSTSLWRDECLPCLWWMSLVRAQTSLLTIIIIIILSCLLDFFIFCSRQSCGYLLQVWCDCK